MQFELFTEFVPSIWQIAKSSDVVLVDSCSVDGQSTLGRDMFDCLFEEGEDAVDGLLYYMDRHRLMAGLAEQWDNIMVTPDVARELRMEQTKLAGRSEYLVRKQGQNADAGLGRKLAIISHIIDSVQRVRKLKERMEWSEDYERFASLYYIISRKLGADYGHADIDMSARAVYEGLRFRRASIITDDTGHPELLEKVYPAVLGMTKGGKANQRLKKYQASIYMPEIQSMGYRLAKSTSELQEAENKDLAPYAEEMRDITEKIAKRART